MQPPTSKSCEEAAVENGYTYECLKQLLQPSFLPSLPCWRLMTRKDSYIESNYFHCNVSLSLNFNKSMLVH